MGGYFAKEPMYQTIFSQQLNMYQQNKLFLPYILRCQLLHCVELQNYHILTNGVNLLLAWIMSSLMRHIYDHQIPLGWEHNKCTLWENKHWGKDHIVALGSDPIIYYSVSFTELFITLTFLDGSFKKIPGRCV